MTGWVKACESGNCLEVWTQPDGSVVIRNSTERDVFVQASAEEWREFVAAVHEGRIA